MKVRRLLGPKIVSKYTHPASSGVLKIDKDELILVLTVRDESNRSILVESTYSISSGTLCPGLQLMELGDRGTFFESGISYPYLTTFLGKPQLFYTGWALGQTVPFYNQIGIAEFDEISKKFKPTEKIPTKIYGDTTTIGVGSVGGVEFNGKHYLYYTSFSSWGAAEEKHRYFIKGAVSDDGVSWRSFSDEDLLKLPFEYCCVCRPSIVSSCSNQLIMFFSYRTNGGDYSLGMARSKDALTWRVDMDNEFLNFFEGSRESWFEKGVCYPNAYITEDDFFLFFGGNEYGRDGFGVIHLSKQEFLEVI